MVNSVPPRGTNVTHNWSIDYEGMHILCFLGLKPKMTYEEVMQVIRNEGGYVGPDECIHRGTAKNKVYTLE